MVLTNHPVITFIGSMKYWDTFLEEATRLHSQGNIIILPHKDPSEGNLSDETRRMYDMMIREQIDLSDEVHVINVNGYIGKSTATELAYAVKKGKTISYYDESKKDKIKIITLCGSFGYTEKFYEVRDKLTMEGNVVFMPSTINSSINMAELTESQIRDIHMIHDKKIMMSDEVFIINPKGYIGSDTRREINFAISMGKKVRYLVDIDKEITKVPVGEENKDGKEY